MICKKCGRELRDNARFCPGCGAVVPVQGDGLKNEYEEEPVKKKSFGVLKVILGILITAVLVAAAAFCVYHFVLKDDGESSGSNGKTLESKEKTDADSEEDEDAGQDVISIAGTQASEAATEAAQASEATTEAAQAGTDSTDSTDNDTITIAGTTEAQAATASMEMKFVDNTSCNISNNLTKDDFQYAESPDGSYHFYYPKYLYNHFDYSDDNGFYFSYVDGGTTTCSLHVYTEDYSGDPISNAETIIQKLKNDLNEVQYSWPPDIAEKGVGDDGIMQVVVSGWTDSSKSTCKYTVAGNDGSKTYCLETTYPEGDVKDETENWDYIVNTLYRYCSFSGTTKAPYSNYNDFRKNEQD